MIKIIQITDCHLFKDKEKTGYADIAPYHSLECVLKTIAVAEQKTQHPDNTEHTQTVLLVTGDISGDSSAESYQHFLSLMDKYVNPTNWHWYVIAGNHDNNAHFDKVLGGKQLVSGSPLTLGNWNVHGLDTRSLTDKHGAKGEVKNKDVNALRVSLKQSLNSHHLLALHHHILPSHSWMDKHFLDNREAVEQLSSDFSQIKAIIHGHIHFPLRQQIGSANTPSYGCPSTCWQWQMQAKFGVSDEAPGYQVVELSSNGDVAVETKRATV